MCSAASWFYSLSLHDALPIFMLSFGAQLCALLGCSALRSAGRFGERRVYCAICVNSYWTGRCAWCGWPRSEEHTSELQSHSDLVCRLLLEKKKRNINRLVQDV